MEMVKFEMEVLNEYTYAQLLHTNNQLKKAKKFIIESREEARELGMIKIAITFEAQLIRVNENIDSVGVAMLSKEANCFDTRGKYELICLN